jgi:hypothetical protein
MQALSDKEIHNIKLLRQDGNSISEISRATGRGKATVSRYVQDVVVSGDNLRILHEKQGGSRVRAEKAWEVAKMQAERMLSPPFSQRERLVTLAALYWAEGTKRELGFINSDPSMIRMFILNLGELGVKKEDLQLSLRIFEDINRDEVIEYWATVLKVESSSIMSVTVLRGKKQGKLPYGMCRVRVKNNAPYFKVLMSMIQILGTHCSSPRSSMDRTAHS